MDCHATQDLNAHEIDFDSRARQVEVADKTVRKLIPIKVVQEYFESEPSYCDDCHLFEYRESENRRSCAVLDLGLPYDKCPQVEDAYMLQAERELERMDAARYEEYEEQD